MNTENDYSANKPKIILDCDPGHDDAVALLVAGRHTELLGVTTVSGNAPLSYTTANALLIAQLAELDVQVYEGAERPLVFEPAHARHVHGDTGLDGPVRPEVTRQPAKQSAVDFIIDTVRTTDDVWLVPIGPLTNIALALRQAPDIVDRVAGVSLMGGSTTVGNVTPVSEFNFWVDPHAAAEVLASGIETIRMAGLNLTHQFYFDKATIEQLLTAKQDKTAGSKPRTVSKFIAELFEFYLTTNKQQTGKDEAPLHDPCAVLAITHPQLFEFVNGHVSVAIGGDIAGDVVGDTAGDSVGEIVDTATRGMSIWDQRPIPAHPSNCEIALSIDQTAGMRIVTDTVVSYP